MDRILSSVPHPHLTHLVRAYAQRQVQDEAADAQPVVASLEQVLQFEFGDPLTVEYRNGLVQKTGQVSIVGAHTYCRAAIRFSGKIESFAVFFQPFGLWQLFHLPNHHLNNQAYDGVELLGGGVRQLWYRMAEASTFRQRVALVDGFLLHQTASALEQTPLMAAAIHIFRNHGTHRIMAVADETGLSLRQFERRFLADVGFAPKLFARITRFQMALDAKLRNPQQSWMCVAHRFGYHDQMHMIQDFRRLGGPSPGKLLAKLGDGRPSALAKSEPSGVRGSH